MHPFAAPRKIQVQPPSWDIEVRGNRIGQVYKIRIDDHGFKASEKEKFEVAMREGFEKLLAKLVGHL